MPSRRALPASVWAPAAPPSPFGRPSRNSRPSAAPRALLALVLLGGAGATALPAQEAALATASRASTQTWIDVGSATVQQPQGTSRLIGSLGAGVWHARRRLTLVADGVTSVATDSAGTSQFSARSAFAPWSFARLDVDGALVSADGFGARSVQLHQQLVWRALSWQLLAGTSRSTRSGVEFFGNTVGTGLTVASGAWRVRGAAQRARTNDYLLMEASGITLARLANAYALDDASVEVGWTGRRLSVGAMQQWRRGREATVGRTSGAALMGSLTLAPGVQLIAQTGTQLADVLRATPQARYLGVTMRWMPTRRASPAPSAPAGLGRTVPSTSAAVVTNAGEVAITREPGRSAVMVTVDAPATAVVEVASSATNWTPARAERRGESFVHRLDLPAGTHTIAVRINGGGWRAPRGLTAVSDDFGGTVGRVTVP